MTERERTTPDLAAAVDDDVGDDMLRLVFTACHPVLSTEARVALTLRLLGGLTTPEIARAFLVAEPTIQQRIVRAKKTLADAGVPFEMPREAERAERLASVLEVIYLIFNEGYAATGGEDWMRPELCNDALRLGRILAGLTPNESEVHGLVALMEIQASRAAARVDAAGAPILLLEQNRGRWTARRSCAASRRWSARRSSTAAMARTCCRPRSRRATPGADRRGDRLAPDRRVLRDARPDRPVTGDRAQPRGRGRARVRPAAGLDIVDTLRSEPALAKYHLLPSVRGDLLAKLGRNREAIKELEKAAELTRNEREKKLLLDRAAELRS